MLLQIPRDIPVAGYSASLYAKNLLSLLLLLLGLNINARIGR